jgi:hypothetical protein
MSGENFFGSQKIVGKQWPALRILCGWEREGGEFIYQQNESASSRRRKTNGNNLSDSHHWD